MDFLDLFAGIGGFRMGLERLGHHCVGFCEIDKFARASYKAIYHTEGEVEFHDITKVRNEEWRQFRGKVDLICGGFPCQAFSIAGKRRGFLDETRGTLFFEIARAAKEIKPPLLLLENVKGLLSHDKGRTFRTILSTLDELGYDAEWQVLNSKDFGVPQNRERVFIIGHLRGRSERTIFPIRGESPTVDSCKPKRLGNGSKIAIPVLTPDRAKKRQNGRRFKTDGEPMFTLTSQDRHGIVIAGRLPSARQQSGRVYSSDGLAPTLSTMQGGDQEPKIIQRARGYNKGGTHQLSPTLSSHHWQENHFVSLPQRFRIRKLTPRECWRLQGFPDWAFDKAQAVNSNSQLYKQAGNSVTVPVIEAIIKGLE
ncbi:DNA (cytosine-5-)-methyltransferase [Streptococcus pasteurianus]|uniref:DNA (cytosine-5-)-methyltransferase n=1 Tax=Streptococcus pasteurianus TaxID=197614 RepID=UPI0005A6F543|nr:DNA (cytosine-5-)-methyltransferase [Streptococcus pasteurianus]